MSPSYRVALSQRARADLASKVRTEAVRQHLLDVARTALDDHEHPDGGVEETPQGVVYWRRGLTVAERHELDQHTRQGNDLDGGEKAYNYGFIYHSRWSPLGRLYYVLAIWHDDDMAAGLYAKPGQRLL